MPRSDRTSSAARTLLLLALLLPAGRARAVPPVPDVTGPVPAAAASPAEVPVKPDPWSGLRFLLGEWTAAGKGAPGEGTGTFTLREDLDGKVLVRRNVSVISPGSGATKPARHEDLLIAHPAAGGTLRAIYFDNEGHVIEYDVTTSAAGAVFDSAPGEGGPRFRLTYEKKEKGEVGVTFAIAPPGKEFATYVSGVVRRK